MKEPPACGEILIEVSGSPVSQQSRRTEKDRFTKFICARFADSEYLLSGDVIVEIEWYVHEQERYESDVAPDVDNILKPLLDALCGPQGVLIDDCQVQAADCRWLDSYVHEQKITILLRFCNDEWVSKNALCFVHFGGGLCFPINLDGPPGAVLVLVEHFCNMLAHRDALVESGREYYEAKHVLPIQRFFHRTRVGRFRTIELDALRKQLEEDITRLPVTAELEELNQMIAETRSLRQRFSKPDGLIGI